MQQSNEQHLNDIAWYLGMVVFFVSLMALLIFVVMKLLNWVDMAWANALFFVALMVCNRFFIWLLLHVRQKMVYWLHKK